MKKPEKRDTPVAFRVRRNAKKALLKRAKQRGFKNIGDYTKNLYFRDGVKEISPEYLQDISRLPLLP